MMYSLQNIHENCQEGESTGRTLFFNEKHGVDVRQKQTGGDDSEDQKHLVLIEETLTDVINQSIFNKNLSALETKFAKPRGAIHEWMSKEGIYDADIILTRLKKTTEVSLGN